MDTSYKLDCVRECPLWKTEGIRYSNIEPVTTATIDELSKYWERYRASESRCFGIKYFFFANTNFFTKSSYQPFSQKTLEINLYFQFFPLRQKKKTMVANAFTSKATDAILNQRTFDADTETTSWTTITTPHTYYYHCSLYHEDWNLWHCNYFHD